jgi:sigma-E factor negative regulatory protein RseA
MMKQANSDQAQPSGCSEAMSRLIDGELDAGGCRALFERLGRDDEARRTWVLLNVACDAVRSSETASLHAPGFVSRVSAALAAEPVVLAPRALRRSSMLRRVGLPSAAVAAAAAVLAIVAVPQLRGPAEAPAPKVAVAPVPAPAPKLADADDLKRSAEFEAYLAAHRESSGGPVTSRANDFITNATLTTESR